MSDSEEDCQLGAESDQEGSELSDGELQEAFSKGLLKPGMNVPVEEPKRAANNVEGLRKCLAEFKRNLAWVERLDLTNAPVVDIVAKAEGRTELSQDGEQVNTEDDFQREMYFYRQAQQTVLTALPKLQKLQIPTKRPEDYFAEMAKSDQHMQKIRKKLIQKQMAMEKSEKAKKLREQRKFSKKVQVQVLQKRQKEKKSMLTAVKKYQKGMSDKLEFLEGDDEGKRAAAGAPSKPHVNKKGPNAKRKFKDSRFGFGGKKKGTKWNTKESYNDVSGFRGKVAHGKVGKKFSKGGNKSKRPGKDARRKMKARK
ncbi:probable rRNA-processing protein EBP2 [Tachysurus fulvidraco]|uniref:probable rRNA-processing protein EBP2 n=1 Tax=Tachysurus fulvidraco TaxID=1234273 RepID=UPI000F4EDA8E|nr:probable rRNA-processing protein EBP2 [Tachysurus fulvidraco]